MKRGDVVIAIFPGSYGKPRPAVVVQSSATTLTHASLTLCPVTSDVGEHDDIRVRVTPTGANGLRLPSDIMVDKIQSLPREQLRAHIGHLEAENVRALDTSLRVWLGLA